MRSSLPLSVSGIFLVLTPCLAEVKTPNSSATDGMGDIKDIYGPLSLPGTPLWLYLLIGAAILLAAAVLLFYFFKRRKAEPTVEIPAHEHALAELARAEQYIENNQSLLYSEKISEILRYYLERRFGLHSTKQTTREFLDSLVNLPSQQQNLLHAHRQLLQSCLEQCDLAKYAHKTAGQEDLQQLKNRVVHFVKETTVEEGE